MKHLISGLVVLLLSSCCKGIDVSHYNDISWEKVAEDTNVEFCYIKATEGKSFVDDKCSSNALGASDIGLKVGFYHYFSTSSSGKEQFDNFNKVLKAHNYQLIPVIDVEEKFNDFSNIDKVNDELDTLITLFYKEYNYYPIIYYGSLIAIKTLPVTYKYKAWIRTIIPTLFSQVGTSDKYGSETDINYCSKLSYITIPE